jgi:hypothetical protein
MEKVGYLGTYNQKNIQKYLVVRASCPLILKDRQDARPTNLGNLFFGNPL